MGRRAAFSLSVSATGFSAPIIGAPPFAGLSGEEIKVAAFGDKSYTKMIAEISEYGDVSVNILDEGDLDFLVPGTVKEFTFATVYKDPAGGSVTRSFVRFMSVKSIEPGGDIEVDGNRKATAKLTLTPVGGDDPATVGLGMGTVSEGT